MNTFPTIVVPVCRTHVYVDENGMWWRYCFTCDDGSNKRQRHPRGHRTEASARMSERDHIRDRGKVRAARVRHLTTLHGLHAADTPEAFVKAWEAHIGRPWRGDGVQADEVMKTVQVLDSWHADYHARVCPCMGNEVKW